MKLRPKNKWIAYFQELVINLECHVAELSRKSEHSGAWPRRRPFARMAQRLSLVSASALAGRLESAASEPTERRLILIDVSTCGASRASFIPGAVAVDMSEVDVYEHEDAGTRPRLVSGNYSLRPPPQLRAALEAIGIHTRRPVVIYSQCAKSAPIASARLAWCLAFAGVRDVGLLQAGLLGWVDAGLPLSPHAAPRSAACDFFLFEPNADALPFPLCPRFCTETAEIRGEVGVAVGQMAHTCARSPSAAFACTSSAPRRRFSLQRFPLRRFSLRRFSFRRFSLGRKAVRAPARAPVRAPLTREASADDDGDARRSGGGETGGETCETCETCETGGETGGERSHKRGNARNRAAHRATQRIVLADVRSWREFVGGSHDYPYPMPCGRLPGAKWAQWGPSTYVGGDFFEISSGEIWPLEQVREIWRAGGVHPSNPPPPPPLTPQP